MKITDSELAEFAKQQHEQTRQRQKMRNALKPVITPLLHQHRFSGTWPHFRRLGKDRHDFLTFYFDKFGNSFVIDLGQTKSDYHQAGSVNYPPPEKRNPWYLEGHQRSRVQPGPFNGKTSSWFRYDDAETPTDFMRIAESVVPFIHQALKMFEDFSNAPKADKTLGF
jgi:Domain of unknown function (DUF4304)